MDLVPAKIKPGSRGTAGTVGFAVLRDFNCFPALHCAAGL